MVLTAEQNLRIALLYEKAAADLLGVPPQQRIAFARKAKWFRMKARIRAKMEAATTLAEPSMNGTACLNEVRPDDSHPDEARLDEAWREQARTNGTAPRSNGAHPDEPCLDEAPPRPPKARPKRYRSIAERIAAARAAQS
jgi:hypothetical protein